MFLSDLFHKINTKYQQYLALGNVTEKFVSIFPFPMKMTYEYVRESRLRSIQIGYDMKKFFHDLFPCFENL